MLRIKTEILLERRLELHSGWLREAHGKRPLQAGASWLASPDSFGLCPNERACPGCWHWEAGRGTGAGVFSRVGSCHCSVPWGHSSASLQCWPLPACPSVGSVLLGWGVGDERWLVWAGGLADSGSYAQNASSMAPHAELWWGSGADRSSPNQHFCSPWWEPETSTNPLTADAVTSGGLRAGIPLGFCPLVGSGVVSRPTLPPTPGWCGQKA